MRLDIRAEMVEFERNGEVCFEPTGRKVYLLDNVHHERLDAIRRLRFCGQDAAAQILEVDFAACQEVPLGEYVVPPPEPPPPTLPYDQED